jgi:hypothetical protein
VQLRLVNMAALLYLDGAPGIRQERIDLAAADAPERLRDLAATQPTLMLIDEEVARGYAVTERFPELRVVRQYPHPGGLMRFLLLEQTRTSASQP